MSYYFSLGDVSLNHFFRNCEFATALITVYNEKDLDMTPTYLEYNRLMLYNSEVYGLNWS